MPIDQVGESSYPKTYMYSGQKLYEFEEYYVFLLKNHIYRTAGHQHWKQSVESGDMEPQGVSLNKKLFGKAVSATDKPFHVYDKQRVRLFKLTDRRMVSQVRGKEKRGDKTLIVLPLEAFSSDDVSKVPKRLR